MRFLQQFGGKPTATHKAQYAKSPNWRDGSFQNLLPTDLHISLTKMPEVIYKQLVNRSGQVPTQPLPIIPFDRDAFLAPSDHAKFIWYGHAVVLLRMAGKTLLIDPMFGENTTPIAPMATKRFSNNTLAIIDDLPEIDLVLFTHDHYDHLDLDSVEKLLPKVKQYFVALGVKRHLVAWGVPAERIVEMDWWDTQALGKIDITFTPTQHFSGRGLTDRLMTLWGGWAFKTPTENIWFSGDGGYGPHFSEIGRRLGPFDFAFMECGQYNEDWRPVHLFPDESVQAALDAGVARAMPFHWGGFPLSYQHTWEEPPTDFVAAAEASDLAYALPKLGEIFTAVEAPKDAWWKAVEVS
ncbi:MAG: MBL fold metallo-hydrolase [Bacteroidota bacterium]